MDAKQNPPLWHLLLILILTVACSKKITGGHKKPQRKVQTVLAKDKDSKRDTEQDKELDELPKAPTPKATTPAEKAKVLKGQWKKVSLDSTEAKSALQLWKKIQKIWELKWICSSKYIGPLRKKDRKVNQALILEAFEAMSEIAEKEEGDICDNDMKSLTGIEDLAQQVAALQEINDDENALYIYRGKNTSNKPAEKPDRYQITIKQSEVLREYLNILTNALKSS